MGGMLMKRSFVLLLSLCAAVTSSHAQDVRELSPATRHELIEYLKEHHQIPEDYVLSTFKTHDIVFLGEWHRIKHDPLLVQHLIPRLPGAGVYSLGYEFARRVDQPLIDSLLNAPAYDEQLARHIAFKQFVHWGFQEYVDIFKAAWELNRTLPPGARRFRILGLNDSPDWSFITSQADRDKHKVMRKVWHGEDWARVLLDEVIARGEKALVYCGIHHAFTRYRQPVAVDGKFIRFGDVRLGNYIYEKIGRRTFTIFLHAPWVNAEGFDAPDVLAADGVIDAIMQELSPEYQQAGFDLEGTPFGKIPGETSLYKFGYKHFTLETIYDGYICQGPFASYEGVTAIKGFVNEGNLAEARAQSPSPDMRDASVEEFYEGAVQDADIPRRLSTLKKP